MAATGAEPHRFEGRAVTTGPDRRAGSLGAEVTASLSVHSWPTTS